MYTTAPMFLLTADSWRENRDRFVKSYRAGGPLARDTGYSEMTDHIVLTKDRSVQRTVFANGVSVTVNFGDRPWIGPDSRTVSPCSFLRNW